MNRFGKLICVLGLAMAFASVAFAQSVAQSAMKMDAGCCCSGSCDMTTKDAMKNHVMSSAKAGCCACCGDSCDMKQMKNVAVSFQESYPGGKKTIIGGEILYQKDIIRLSVDKKTQEITAVNFYHNFKR